MGTPDETLKDRNESLERVVGIEGHRAEPDHTV